jgi:hypothetical protein
VKGATRTTRTEGWQAVLRLEQGHPGRPTRSGNPSGSTSRHLLSSFEQGRRVAAADRCDVVVGEACGQQPLDGVRHPRINGVVAAEDALARLAMTVRPLTCADASVLDSDTERDPVAYVARSS